MDTAATTVSITVASRLALAAVTACEGASLFAYHLTGARTPIISTREGRGGERERSGEQDQKFSHGL
jgi:hypothetical protein